MKSGAHDPKGGGTSIAPSTDEADRCIAAGHTLEDRGLLPLDSIELDACHFIKVDVDGSEIDVLRSGEMQIERFRPILYFENEIQEKSAELLAFVMNALGYNLYFHPAPLFDPGNFFGNPVNQWAPTELVSMMVLGVPKERKLDIGLKRIADPNDWWNFGMPISSYLDQ